MIFFSIAFIFQKDPGYMDSEFYYLAGKQLANGKLTIPVIWNYLDNPVKLPAPIFSYWMPGASILASISMKLFGDNFLGSRILSLLIALGIAPLSYVMAFKLSTNRATSFLTGVLSIFSGFYFKFITIPETVMIYILLGGLYFFSLSQIIQDFQTSKSAWKNLAVLGIVAGGLHLTRVDGLFFYFFGVFVIIFFIFKKQGISRKCACLQLLTFTFFYLIIMSFWFISNLQQYGTLFSPSNSKAFWIATYDDTFIYPPSGLTLNYWIENGLPLRFSQIINGLKINLGTFVGVQTAIIGLPLFMIGIKRRIRNTLIFPGILHLFLIFIIMTIVFPLAGARGGFLHSSAANQIIIWILMADGFHGFLEWGVRKRNWQLVRSQKMFGSALVVLVFLFTVFIYSRDVIGKNINYPKWSFEYSKFNEIEKKLEEITSEKTDVVMVNNPLGYNYSSGRWSVVIPNSEVQGFYEVIQKFHVKFIVVDKNLPEKFNENHQKFIINNFYLLKRLEDGSLIYAINEQ